MRSVVKFLQVYIVFVAFVLLVNLSLELLVSPENRKIIEEHGWTYFLQHQLVGIIIFFLIFSFVGAAIFLKTSYNPRKMGILSFIIGFVLEFTIMKPEWVQNIFALKIGGDVIGAIIVSSLYWFITWGAPSYIFNKIQGKL